MTILDRFKLDGKIAVVTGCRRGIGKALAVALAEAGADIVGVSKSLEPSGSDVEKAVVQAGRKFRCLSMRFSPAQSRPRIHRPRDGGLSRHRYSCCQRREPRGASLRQSTRTNIGTRSSR